MGNTTVLLIRHGDVDSPVDAFIPTLYGPREPLNDHGKRQISHIAAQFNKQKLIPERIYTSSFERASQAARILSETLVNHPMVIAAEGISGAHTPQWDHRPLTELDRVGDNLFADNPALPDVHGETLPQAYERVTRAYTNILESNRGKTVAIVTHNEIAGMIMHHITHDGKELPGIGRGVGKGEALVLTVSPEGRLLEMRIFTPEGPILSKERAR